MPKEIEATFLAIDKKSMRAKLKRAGFVLKTPEYLMRRKAFDFSRVAPGQSKRKWGRVRQEADKITMSVKEITGKGINDVSEIELVVNDFDTATAFFEACNIPVKSYQETKRELWTKDKVEVTIDTWPSLRPILEIEGPDAKQVQTAAQELGFDFSQAFFGSADMIYEKELGIPAEIVNHLPEITFAKPPSGKTK